jgi:hypothetical protein
MNRDGFPAGGIQKCINPDHLFVFFHSIILIVFIILSKNKYLILSERNPSGLYSKLRISNLNICFRHEIDEQTNRKVINIR